MPSDPTYLLFAREEAERPKLITVLDRLPSDSGHLEHFAIANIPYREQENGLPADGELSRITAIERQLEDALVPRGAFHLGHITFNGAMQVAFLAPAAIEKQFKVGPRMQIELEVRHDPDYRWFQAEMVPNTIEFEMAKNQQLQDKLRNLGDVAELVRPVDFWSYFSTAKQRTSFIKAIAEERFRVTNESKRDGELPFGCQFAIDTDVEPYTMGCYCAFLRSETRKAGGDFDGWACHVKKA